MPRFGGAAVTVRYLTGNPEYRIERGAGVVSAKTMTTADGVVIALNSFGDP
ncbi:hypothetical protein ACW9HH_32830 [Nocardia gipuzkoensis]